MPDRFTGNSSESAGAPMTVQLFVIDDGSWHADRVLSALEPALDLEVVGRAALRDLGEHSDKTPEYLLVHVNSVMNASDEDLLAITQVFGDAHIFVVTDLEVPGNPETTTQVPAGDEAFVALRNAGAAGVLIHREFAPSLVPHLNGFVWRNR